MLAPAHGHPIFTSLFEKNVIFPGANRASAVFQPRFSRVSATLQPRFSSLEILFLWRFFCDPKISAFLKVKLLVKLLIFVFQLRFSWQKRGAHPLMHRPVRPHHEIVKLPYEGLTASLSLTGISRHIEIKE